MTDIAWGRLFAVVEIAMGVAAFLVAIFSHLGWWGFPVGWAASACFDSGIATWRDWSEVDQ